MRVSRVLEAIWGAAAFLARGVLRLIPPNAGQRGAIARLRQEFARLPPIREEPGEVWPAYRKELKNCVLSRDPRAFLTWRILRETMVTPPYARFARAELKFLQQTSGSDWKRAIRERGAGLPFPYWLYPLSSSTAIHHAYHLRRFEVETGWAIADFEAVIEFGGGYGSLCRIARNRGFGGRYILFDTPEQSALQRYYLSSLGVDAIFVSELEALRVEIERLRPGRRLFIATWSLSEAPLVLRRRIGQLVENFDAFLIAYQERFAGIDNCAFFEEWQRWFPGVAWRSLKIEQLPGNQYLFGAPAAAK